MLKVKDENVNLADDLLKLRQELGLTQEEFAEKIGISRQAVSRWEMGISVHQQKL